MRTNNFGVLSLVVGAVFSVGYSSEVLAQDTKSLFAVPKTESELKEDRDFKDSKNVLVKLFYIAMRDKSSTKLQDLIDPMYLEKHHLKDGFETVTIPVNNVYDIQVSPDRRTLMCHLLKDGKKTGVVVLNVVRRGKALYIVPPTPPEGNANLVTPWLMHANLDAR